MKNKNNVVSIEAFFKCCLLKDFYTFERKKVTL